MERIVWLMGCLGLAAAASFPQQSPAAQETPQDHPSPLPAPRWQELEPTPAPEYNLTWALPDPPPTRVAFRLEAVHTPEDLRLACDWVEGRVRLLRQKDDHAETLLEAPLDTPQAGDVLTLQRRAGRLALLINGRRSLSTDLPWPTGAAGWEAPAPDLQPPRYQPVEPVYFSDDFMRTAEELGAWEVVRGTGEIRVLKNAERSTNAFTLLLRPEDGYALAVTGQPFWSDYRLSASIQPHQAGGGFGLVYHWQDEGDFSLVRWQGEEEGRLQLIEVRQGQASVLFEVPARWRPEIWYRLEVWSTGGRVQLRVDGERLWDLPDTGCAQGGVGLYTEGPTSADFDDVQALGADRWTETFERPQPLRWQVARGAASWRDGALRAGKDALLLAGADDWRPGRVTVALREAQGAVGLLLGAADGGAVWLQRLPDRWECRQGTWDGPGELLASAPAADLVGPAEWTVHTDQGWLGVEEGGVLALQCFSARPCAGRVGLWSETGALFERLAVEFQQERYPPDPLVTDLFVRDPYMTAWANPEGQWVALPATAEENASPSRFQHKGLLFGDWQFSLPLEDWGGRAGTMTLVLTPPGPDARPRATFRLSWEKERLRWQVSSTETVYPEGEWIPPEGMEAGELRLERFGAFLALGVEARWLASYPIFDEAKTP